MPSDVNLFLDTRRFAVGRYEDHLTEFIAASLELSPHFREAFASTILGSYAERNGWPVPKIRGVSTQVDFRGTGCCVDMVVRLVGDKTIAFEHKIDAPETLGAESGKPDQLKRYLALDGVDGLVFVRASWKPLGSDILNDPKYIHPANREHFLWHDLYPLLENQADGFLSWMRDGFQHLGFMPPHPRLGDPRNKDDRRNFKELWAKTRSLARGEGWRVTTGSLIELYLEGGPNSLAKMIWITPTDFTTLILRVSPITGREEDVSAALQAAVEQWSSNAPCAVTQRRVRRAGGPELVFDVSAPLKIVLGEEHPTVQQMQQQLGAFVGYFIEAVRKKEQPSSGMPEPYEFDPKTGKYAYPNGAFGNDPQEGRDPRMKPVTDETVFDYFWGRKVKPEELGNMNARRKYIEWLQKNKKI